MKAKKDDGLRAQVLALPPSIILEQFRGGIMFGDAHPQKGWTEKEYHAAVNEALRMGMFVTRQINGKAVQP